MLLETATLTSASSLSGDLQSAVIDGRVRLSRQGRTATLHPLWLRERSTAAGEVDSTNRQRLVEPLDIAVDLTVVQATASPDGDVEVAFCDGHVMRLGSADVDAVLGTAAGSSTGELAPPAPEAWQADDMARTGMPLFDYDDVASDAGMSAALDRYFRHGWFVLRGTPAVAGALHEITAHFGRISPTNFGVLFDVRTEPVPADLAYTPVALSAHTDQPYRRPTPGLQFLHTIVNDAPGGASTIVDGLAAVEALATADRAAYDVLTTLPVEFRYDIGTDVKSASAPLIQLRSDGTLGQLRYSPRLDFAPAVDVATLDAYYRGRRWLAAELNSPSRQVEVKMAAGDVLVVDNHRVLHGRTSFDPSRGRRHLQGCYIDHDGPETAWRLAQRRMLLER